MSKKWKTQPKSESSSQEFRTLEDRARAFELGAQLATTLSEINAEQIASQPTEETSASPMPGDLLLEDLMETYPEVSRDTLEAILQRS